MFTGYKWIGLLVAVVLMVSGCGRKEAPQMLNQGAAPQLQELQHQADGSTLILTFTLAGMAEGVGYQIDRTELDPYCQCPGFWRRYFDQPPRPKLVGEKHTKIIRLNSKKEFVFRIRAYDEAGNLGQWSRSFRAHGVDLFNK